MRGREARLRERIAELENLLGVVEDYGSMFRNTRENIGKFSVRESPRMILREITGSFIAAAAAFDSINTGLVRRFTSLVDEDVLLVPNYSEAHYDQGLREGSQRFALSIVDRGNAVTIPEGCRGLFKVKPPQKSVFTAAKCRAGLDYEHFVRLHEYLVAGEFRIVGEVVIIFVSVRNGADRAEDYYQVWVPVA